MKKLKVFLFFYFIVLTTQSFSSPLTEQIRSMALWLIFILIVPVIFLIVFLIKKESEKWEKSEDKKEK